MKNNFDLNDYQLINEEITKKCSITMIVSLIILIIGIILIIFNFKFKVYEKQTLIKNNNNFNLIVNSTVLENYKTYKYITINQKKYTYDTIKIVDDYSNINGIIYQTIEIALHNYETDAVITECYFLISNETIYEKLIKFVTGGKYAKN